MFWLAVTSFPDGAVSVLLIMTFSIPIIALIRKYSSDKDIVANIFLIGLIARISLGIFIHTFDLRNIMGPDAAFYHEVGKRLSEIWWGMNVPDDILTQKALFPGNSGWGMNYIVAGIYMVFGPGILVSQSFCGVVGALTAPMTYYCSERVFNNKRVSRYAALFIALFPSFVVWSSQLLKDGLIIFLLVCIMTALLQLQRKISFSVFIALLTALFGIFALRFYIFYMIAIAVVGSFFIGTGHTKQSIVRNFVIVALLGIFLTYFGVANNASKELETYGSLERMQLSRKDLSQSADSGFGKDLDVSTFSGAIEALPTGLVYLFFAPFPWEISKLSQLTVMPETLLWWAFIPFLIIGLKYTITTRFRSALPILVFSLMLTILYSLFQGNVGMLYRQRTQIQVFLFMFIAVGVALIQEKRENEKLKRQIKQDQLMGKLKSLKDRESY